VHEQRGGRWLGGGAMTASHRCGGEKSRVAARSRGEWQSRGRASGEKKTSSIRRWTATTDKGDLRCRTWGGGHQRRTVTIASMSVVSRMRAGDRCGRLNGV
jgi:hypothetical protein